MFCYDDKFCFINYTCIPDVVSFRNERNLTCCSHFISNNTTKIFPPFFHDLCLICLMFFTVSILHCLLLLFLFFRQRAEVGLWVGVLHWAALMESQLLDGIVNMIA